jgi:hypothetical protein
MKYLFKKIFFIVLFLFCFLFSLTTLCDDVYARQSFSSPYGGSGASSVPEPSTLLLLAAGVGAFYFTRQKNKK